MAYSRMRRSRSPGPPCRARPSRDEGRKSRRRHGPSRSKGTHPRHIKPCSYQVATPAGLGYIVLLCPQHCSSKEAYTLFYSTLPNAGDGPPRPGMLRQRSMKPASWRPGSCRETSWPSYSLGNKQVLLGVVYQNPRV